MSGLASAVDEYAAEPLAAVPNSVLAADAADLLRLAERAHAEALRRYGELDHRTGDDDEETVPALIRRERLCTTWHAKEQVRIARRLRTLPAVATAFADGVIGYAHTRLIAGAATDQRMAAVQAGQRDLVDAAARLDPRGLRIWLADWRHRTDPAESLAEEQDLRQQRRFRVQGGFDDLAYLEGELHPEGIAFLRAALGAARDRTWTADDTRTADQRTADALVTISRHYLDSADTRQCGGERPHVTVTVPLATLEARAGATAARLSDGTICSETARRLACDAQITRVITDPDGIPIDIGRATRTISTGTRKALNIRDGGCVADGCQLPARVCDGHHITHWAPPDLGPTNLDNLALLCGHHHTCAHERGWTIRRKPDGRPVLRPPPSRLDLRDP